MAIFGNISSSIDVFFFVFVESAEQKPGPSIQVAKLR